MSVTAERLGQVCVGASTSRASSARRVDAVRLQPSLPSCSNPCPFTSSTLHRRHIASRRGAKGAAARCARGGGWRQRGARRGRGVAAAAPGARCVQEGDPPPRRGRWCTATLLTTGMMLAATFTGQRLKGGRHLVRSHLPPLPARSSTPCCRRATLAARGGALRAAPPAAARGAAGAGGCCRYCL